jgi:hypothetical protein
MLLCAVACSQQSQPTQTQAVQRPAKPPGEKTDKSIEGTMTDSKGAIENGEIGLTYYPDENCLNLGQKSGLSKEEREQYDSEPRRRVVQALFSLAAEERI